MQTSADAGRRPYEPDDIKFEARRCERRRDRGAARSSMSRVSKGPLDLCCARPPAEGGPARISIWAGQPVPLLHREARKLRLELAADYLRDGRLARQFGNRACCCPTPTRRARARRTWRPRSRCGSAPGGHSAASASACRRAQLRSRRVPPASPSRSLTLSARNGPRRCMICSGYAQQRNSRRSACAAGPAYVWSLAERGKRSSA